MCKHFVQGLFLYTCCYANFVWWIYVDSYMCRLKGLKETTLHNRRVTAIDKPHQFDAQLWKFGKGECGFLVWNPWCHVAWPVRI